MECHSWILEIIKFNHFILFYFALFYFLDEEACLKLQSQVIVCLDNPRGGHLLLSYFPNCT